MWESLAQIVAQPNFIQGGMTIVTLALLGVLIYLLKMLNTLVNDFANRAQVTSEIHSEQLRLVSQEASDAVKSGAEAHIKLAESLARHSLTIESFGRIIERKM